MHEDHTPPSSHFTPLSSLHLTPLYSHCLSLHFTSLLSHCPFLHFISLHSYPLFLHFTPLHSHPTSLHFTPLHSHRPSLHFSPLHSYPPSLYFTPPHSPSLYLTPLHSHRPSLHFTLILFSPLLSHHTLLPLSAFFSPHPLFEKIFAHLDQMQQNADRESRTFYLFNKSELPCSSFLVLLLTRSNSNNLHKLDSIFNFYI
jgi:hypothetical protein